MLNYSDTGVPGKRGARMSGANPGDPSGPFG